MGNNRQRDGKVLRHFSAGRKHIRKMGMHNMVSNRVETDVSVVVEPRVAVVGIGGAGCNVASGFYAALAPVDTVIINTDKKALDEQPADKKIYICKAVTKGEGTKGDARLGKRCAKIHEDEIEKALAGYDAVFLIAGLGGGTGTGAAAVVAEICSRKGLMTFAVTINPFFFESSRLGIAADGLKAVRAVCPNTFVIENDKILQHMPDATMDEAMRAVNKSIMGFVMDAVYSMPEMVVEETESMIKKSKHKTGRGSVGNISETKIPAWLKA